MKPWPFSLSVITPPLDPSITTSVGAVAVEADSDGCESSASIVPRFDSVTFESWDLRALSGRLDRAADLHRSRAASRRFALAHARDPETAIEAAILRGLLKPEETTQAWSVIDSVYRTQLSDRALNWLTDNAVITTEQRTNAAAILRRISDWLERAAAR